MTHVYGGVYSWNEKLQNAQAGNANGEEIITTGRMGAMAVLVLQVVGAAFTGTVNFEATVDGTNWIAIQATNLNDGTSVLTATASGLFRINALGLYKVRARTSVVTGGSVTVTACLVA